MTRSVSAVFLDRDGTLNVSAPDGAYITHPDQLRLLAGAGEAVARLNAAEIPVAIVTNQRGVARGLMTEEDLHAIHGRLTTLLARHGASFHDVLFCPHENGVCACRKPLPGLILRAAERLHVAELSRAVTVGDSESDIAAGRAAGTQTIRLAKPLTDTAADFRCGTLGEAVTWLLGP